MNILWLIHSSTTNLDDCSQKLDIHGLPKAIFKMSAAENVEKLKLAFSRKWLLFALDLQLLSKYMFLRVVKLNKLVILGLLLNKL